MILLFNIKTKTLGFAFCQPQKKSLPKSLTQKKKSLQNFNPKKSPQIANFKPKKALGTSPSLIYLSTPPPPPLGLRVCPCISYLRSTKAVQTIGDKSQQIPCYARICPRGQPPWMAADKCISELTYPGRNSSGLLA